MADVKKKKVYYSNDNPIELGKSVAGDIAEVPKAIFDTALEQIGLKPQKKPMAGEINLASGIHKTNQEIDTKSAQIDRKLQQLQSVQKQEKEVYNLQHKAVQEQIHKLMQELSVEVKRLEAQTAELTADVKKITVESMPSNPSLYHLNFFDWVIGTLRDLRKRVSESRLWLNMWNQKKKQKGYWAMFKKHGTSFAMSDERSAASSAG